MATDQGVGGSNPLTHVNCKKKSRTDCPAFFIQRTSGSDSNGFGLRSAPVGAKRMSTGLPAVYAPLRSALNEDPLDLQRPLTHYCSLFSFSMCAAKCRRYIIRAYSVVIVINVFFVYRLDRTIPIVSHVDLLKGKAHCRQKRIGLM